MVQMAGRLSLSTSARMGPDMSLPHRTAPPASQARPRTSITSGTPSRSNRWRSRFSSQKP